MTRINNRGLNMSAQEESIRREEIDAIIEELKVMTPDNKVRVVLKEMGLEDRELKFDEEAVQREFYDYSLKYPALFNEFSFTTTGTYPYSRLLERILQRMKIPQVLKTVNPGYECMKLATGTDEYVEKEIIKFMNPDDYKVLKSMGQSLKEKSQYGEYCTCYS